ncbi:sensor histidine kinase [Mucilaginibacter paludis]|nr:HAMP domain-containing sensor histidine kinase [Mucilaginibacter paludis]
MNYYTIKILSASRAYIAGESQYSKGQKDASSLLITYIHSRDPAAYSSFIKNIKIPIGDRVAREALAVHKNEAIARQGFLQANNSPEDIDDMLWLFKRFERVDLFAKAINIWYQGDVMIEQLRQLGVKIHQISSTRRLSTREQDALIIKVNALTMQLTIKEQAFSETFGIVCRKVNSYIFFANILTTLIIILSAVFYAGRVIHKMEASRIKILEQNEHLKAVNKDLDQLIYSVTHDLRSPLTSISGLIGLIDKQTELSNIKPYISMVKISIEKQNQFIKSVLKSAKKQNLVARELCDVAHVVDDVIAQNHTMLNGKEIQFIKELRVTDIYCDATKLLTILNNLISNAVKYSDVYKQQPFIIIRSSTTPLYFIIEVRDNGIGIDEENIPHIFEKDFMVKKNDHSEGVGLYLVKNMIQQMQGEILVNSTPGHGTTFTVKLPLPG